MLRNSLGLCKKAVPKEKFLCTCLSVYVLTDRWTGAHIHLSVAVCQLPVVVACAGTFSCVYVGLACHFILFLES